MSEVIFPVSAKTGAQWEDVGAQQGPPPTLGLWKAGAYKPTTLKGRTEQTQLKVSHGLSSTNIYRQFLWAPLDWNLFSQEDETPALGGSLAEPSGDRPCLAKTDRQSDLSVVARLLVQTSQLSRCTQI